MKTNVTGYGPSARLIFDGDEKKFELWEIKFLGYLRLKKLDAILTPLVEDANETVRAAGATKNADAFAELIQALRLYFEKLVENCDLLEDRRTLTPFQRQANHSNFRSIDSRWRALFCIEHDHVKWRANVLLSHYKAYFGKIFHIFII